MASHDVVKLDAVGKCDFDTMHTRAADLSHNVCRHFLTESCGSGLYEFPIGLRCYSMQYMSGPATLVIQYAHPHGLRLRGVHVLMKK